MGLRLLADGRTQAPARRQQARGGTSAAKADRLKLTEKSGGSMAALKALRHPKTPDRPKHTALPKTSHRAEHSTTPYAATRKMRRRPQTVAPLKTPYDARCCAGQDAAAKQEAVSQTTCGAPHETPQPNKGRARDKMRRLSRGFFANRDRWFSFDDSRLGKKKKVRSSMRGSPELLTGDVGENC
jgi:hypothetical protein